LLVKPSSRSKKIQFLVSFSVKTRPYTTCVVTNSPTQESLIMAKYLVYIPPTSSGNRVLVNVVTNRKNYYSVKWDVLKAAIKSYTSLRNVIPCSLEEIDRYMARTCCFRIWSWKELSTLQMVVVFSFQNLLYISQLCITKYSLSAEYERDFNSNIIHVINFIVLYRKI
jgi:hypothetical protein